MSKINQLTSSVDCKQRSKASWNVNANDKANTRKCTTSVINFPDTLPIKDFISDVKKKCQCNGSIKNNRKNPEKTGNIEFSGNIKTKIRDILILNLIQRY